MSDSNTLKVIELFAGVGGFHCGLKEANSSLFKVTWANQWEPSRKAQDAFDCYKEHFPEATDSDSNVDIAKIPNEKFKEINPDLVVGGFPCQDYSVARTLSGEKGIQGKKGVLFWEIKRVLENGNPKYVLLENVDRLLKSPSSQRGRDFAVMLATFRDLGYYVEWRVINAAEYGFAQRRRRVFIFAYKSNEQFGKDQQDLDEKTIIFEKGFFAKSFPVKEKPYKGRGEQVTDWNILPQDIVEVSDEFTYNFHPAGIMRDGKIYNAHVEPIQVKPKTLKEILTDEKVDEKFFLTPEVEEKFKYLRDSKKIERTSADGHKYFFSEGGMSPTDELDKPGRTMLTSEGSINRSTHIIEVNGRKRFLTPNECEKLNGFPVDWTAGMSDRMRYFCMGNALVVGLIEIMGKRIEEIEKESQPTDIQLELTLS